MTSIETVNVLHLWKTDRFGGGGGAIAMYRLHDGLRDKAVDSKILCLNKTTDSPFSIKLVSPSKFLQKLEHRIKRFSLKRGLHDIYRLNYFAIKNNALYQKADIVHIHGTHGFLNYLTLPFISRKQPTIYTLHDMWPFTGHCGYSYDCKRWETGCGHCPYPENHPAIQKDNTRIEWHLKRMVYQLSNLTIVTLSDAKTEEARKSILRRLPIYQIPNGLDLTVFKPLNPDICRKKLGLPTDKTILMFAALSLSQHNKGGDLLFKALQRIPAKLKSNMVLLTIGENGDKIQDWSGVETKNLGFIKEDNMLAEVYSAADFFVSPTRAESLSLVIQESMACGVPVVAFNVGGNPDVVRHGENGYLVEPENDEDLSIRIVQILEGKNRRQLMGQKSRELMIKDYSIEQQVNDYIALYQNTLNTKKHKSKTSNIHHGHHA